MIARRLHEDAYTAGETMLAPVEKLRDEIQELFGLAQEIGSTIDVITDEGDELKQGEVVCIFPEGGLTRTGHVQAFQRGVERLIGYSPETPVIPIYLDGLWRHPLTANGPRSFRDWVRAATG